MSELRRRINLEPLEVKDKPRTKNKKRKKGPKRSIHDYSRDFIDALFNGEADESEVDDDIDPVELAIKMDKQENDFDIRKIIKKSVDPVTGLPTSMKLPEGDFPEASSFFDFCSNFVSKDTRFPFARQMWIMSNLFGECCPRCSDPKWMADIRNVPVDFKTKEMPERIQFMKYGICPKCKTHKSAFINKGRMKMFSELDLEAGQRSGKSTITSTGSAYLTHKYVKFPKLSSVCEGIQASTPLTATFVGYRLTDAMNLLWQPITDIIDNSPWFISYHAMLTDYGSKYGTEFFRMKDIYLKYFHKNIELGPASPSKRALRGRTRFLTAIDELGWFPTDDSDDENESREYASADGTYNALDRSLLTVRSEVELLFKKGYNNFLPGIAINISSPSSQTDKIHRLVEENQDSPTVLALRLPTWEVNPRIPRDSAIIKKAYADNPAKAERDYGANPPLNALIFIDTLEARRGFKMQNRVELVQVEREIDNRIRIGADIAISSPRTPTPPSLLALDAGFSNNAFAFVILHEVLGQRSQQIVGSDVMTPAVDTKLIVDAMVEIQPEHGKTLHYEYIFRKTIRKLIEDFNVRYVFADRWNSLSILHRIEEEYPHVKALQYSPKYNDFILFKSFMTDGRLLVPQMEMEYDEVTRIENYPFGFAGKPMSHFMFQLKTVRDKGNTVVKGDKFTDDLFRAAVLGVSRFMDRKVLEEMRRFGALHARRNKQIGSIAAGRGGTFVPQLPSYLIDVNQSQTKTVAISSSSMGPNSVPSSGLPQGVSNIITVSRFGARR
jgi:hypothetical protein